MKRKKPVILLLVVSLFFPAFIFAETVDEQNLVPSSMKEGCVSKQKSSIFGKWATKPEGGAIIEFLENGDIIESFPVESKGEIAIRKGTYRFINESRINIQFPELSNSLREKLEYEVFKGLLGNGEYEICFANDERLKLISRLLGERTFAILTFERIK